jgi:hypothetical protein
MQARVKHAEQKISSRLVIGAGTRPQAHEME